MIQIVFIDNSKVHTVTFSGDDADYWSMRFKAMLIDNSIDYKLRQI